MTTLLTRPAPAKPQPSVQPCEGCGRPTVRPANHVGPLLCQRCQRACIAADAAQVIIDLQRLRDGRAPFDVLTESERAEILAGAGPNLTLNSPKFPGFATLPPEVLTGIIADDAPLALSPGESVADVCGAAAQELARRVDNAHAAVTVARDETEQQIEAEEATSGDRWDGLS